MSAVAAGEGDAAGAARNGGAAEALREAYAGRPYAHDRAVTERYLAAARAAIDPEAWASAWEAGRALPLHLAIEEALATERE